MNAYVSNLQVVRRVVGFLTRRLGNPIPSPALFNHIGNRLRREVHAFAEEHDVLILKLKKVDRTRFDDRKIDHVRSYMDKAEHQGRFSGAAVVSAQEFQWVFGGKDRAEPGGRLDFELIRPERRVGVYYILRARPRMQPGVRQDRHLLPLPGHALAEGARVGQALGRRGRARQHPACQWVLLLCGPCQPAAHLRSSRGGGDLAVLRAHDGDHPPALHRRRPSGLGVVRGPRGGQRLHRPPREGDHGLFLQAFPAKQYLKEGRASRIETVVNKCSALGLQSRIEHPLELVAKARRVHDRLLAIDHN